MRQKGTDPFCIKFNKKGGIFLKVIFMGTPDFARDSLEALYNAGHDIKAVITVPDKPKRTWNEASSLRS